MSKKSINGTVDHRCVGKSVETLNLDLSSRVEFFTQQFCLIASPEVLAVQKGRSGSEQPYSSIWPPTKATVRGTTS